MVLLGPGWALWIANEILDGKAGLIHDYFRKWTKALAFEPIFELGVLIYIANGYGTDE